MNTRMQTDAWIYSIAVVLGLIVVASAVSTIALVLRDQPVPEILVVLGSVTASGLARLLISPLNGGLLK